MPAVKKSIATALPANPYNRCAIPKTDTIARSEVRLAGPSKIARPSVSCRWRVLARRISKWFGTRWASGADYSNVMLGRQTISDSNGEIVTCHWAVVACFRAMREPEAHDQ